MKWAFPEKNVTSLLRIQWKMPGGGVNQKMRKKHGFPGESMQKYQRHGKFQGGHGKFDWKSRRGRALKKKSISSTGGFFIYYFLEKQIGDSLLKIYPWKSKSSNKFPKK